MGVQGEHPLVVLMAAVVIFGSGIRRLGVSKARNSGLLDTCRGLERESEKEATGRLPGGDMGDAMGDGLWAMAGLGRGRRREPSGSLYGVTWLDCSVDHDRIDNR